MEISIKNWDKFNKSEIKRTPHWFKVHMNIGSSESLFGLPVTTKWVWICLLGEAMRKRSGKFKLNIGWAAKNWDLKEKEISEAIRFLEQNDLVTTDCQSTANQLPTDWPLEREREREKEREIDNAQNEFELEGLYGLYPRKVGKKKGLEKLKVLVKSRKDYEAIKNAIKNYSDYCTTAATAPKYIKYFDSFLSVWEDFRDPVTETSFKKTDISAILGDSA